MKKINRIPVPIIFILLGCVLVSCKPEKEVKRIINSYNYIRLVPASNLFGPGDLVARVSYNPRDREPDSASLTPLCSRKYSTERYQKDSKSFPSVSRSESMQIFRNFSGGFSLSADQFKSISNINVSSNIVKEVNGNIDDILISTYSEEDLARIRISLGSICKELVLRNVNTNNAYQIKETLLASVSYSIELKNDASASAKAKLVEELGSASLTVDSESKYTIKGEGLVYGIRWVELDGL